jgi:hypothetical protein
LAGESIALRDLKWTFSEYEDHLSQLGEFWLLSSSLPFSYDTLLVWMCVVFLCWYLISGDFKGHLQTNCSITTNHRFHMLRIKTTSSLNCVAKFKGFHPKIVNSQ